MLFFKYKIASGKPKNSIFPLNRTINQLEFIKDLLCVQHREAIQKNVSMFLPLTS